MRIAVVTVGGLPDPEQNGGTLVLWSIVRHLVAVGHDVHVVAVLGEEPADGDAELDRRVRNVVASGAHVALLRSGAARLFETMESNLAARVRRAVSPSDEELFPHLRDAAALRGQVEALAPDVLLAYHWDAVAASRGLRGVVPRFAAVVDLPHLSALYRWQATPGRLSKRGLERLVWLQARLRRMPRLLVALLNECEASADFAAQHAAWLQKRGADRCEYLRTPIEDRASEHPVAARAGSRAGERPRLLLIGHLRGISTLEGLDLFARGVLPRLEQALGPNGLEVRLVGDHEPPPHLRAALSRPNVRFVGHVERAADEFEAADALIVPTPIRLGARVRILTAFSHACPVVAHEANALGIPELVHGDNVLLGATAADLGGAAVRLLEDESLRRTLALRGRETYERFFAPAVAAAALEERLRAIAADREHLPRTAGRSQVVG